MFGFADHMFSVSTIQLCPSSVNAATDNMKIQEHGCVPVGLLTSPAPSPTSLPLLKHASAIQAPFFSFWNILTCSLGDFALAISFCGQF